MTLSPIQVASPIRVKEPPSNKNYSLTEIKIRVYEFAVSPSNYSRILARLEKKKSDSYYTTTGALCLLFFSNLVFAQESSSFLSTGFHALVSAGSIITAIGGAHIYNKLNSTLEKVKLLFGSKDQQNEALLQLAKSLPKFAVKESHELPTIEFGNPLND